MKEERKHLRLSFYKSTKPLILTSEINAEAKKYKEIVQFCNVVFGGVRIQKLKTQSNSIMTEITPIEKILFSQKSYKVP